MRWPTRAATKPVDPRWSRRTGRGCSTSTDVDGAAEDVALEAGPDDLDLGELGHGSGVGAVGTTDRGRHAAGACAASISR